MKKHIFLSYQLLFLCFFTFLTCKNAVKNIPQDVHNILSTAGDNKAELEKVIIHYSRPKDSLKLKATYFLIRNMEGRTILDSTSVKGNQIYFDALSLLWSTNRKMPDVRIASSLVQFTVDSVNMANKLDPFISFAQYQPELQNISSKFLINNIEQAFFAWENMPWSKHITFSVFCQYILPYRSTDTYSESSRAYFLAKSTEIIDSVKKSSNSFKAAAVMMRFIDTWFLEETQLFAKNPYLRPMKFSDLLKGKVGTCIDNNSVRVAALRAIGIPATIDELPNWGSLNGSHYWCKIIDPVNDTIQSLITNAHSSSINTNHIIPSSSYYKFDTVPQVLPKAVNVSYLRTVPKVYRNTFKKQINPIISFPYTDEEIPSYFKNPWLKDVSDEYLVCADVEINLNNYIPNERYSYLCVYDNVKWKPVAIAPVKFNKANFKNMGRNIVYLPAYYYQGEITPAGKPFLLNLNGEQKELNGEDKTTEKVKLYTKYPYRSFINFRQNGVIGVRFQFSNRSDLPDSITVHK